MTDRPSIPTFAPVRLLHAAEDRAKAAEAEVVRLRAESQRLATENLGLRRQLAEARQQPLVAIVEPASSANVVIQPANGRYGCPQCSKTFYGEDALLGHLGRAHGRQAAPKRRGMDRTPHDTRHKWHVALNQANFDGHTFRHWMYDGMAIADEVPRLTMLFRAERLGKLPGTHRQCSHSEAEPIADNHLTCCLGVACRSCDALQALERAELPPEQIDAMKAWTCVAHILNEQSPTSRIDTSEGFVLTTDDRMFWDGVYSSLARADTDGA